MIDLNSPRARMLSFVSGASLYMGVFRHGEWDLQIRKICSLFLAGQLLLFALLVLTGDEKYSYREACRIVTLLGLYLLSGMYLSMVTHRGFFHRLSMFPGPFWARLSNIYAAMLAKDLHFCYEVAQLHQKYGDFVRLGPSELSITHPDALLAIHSPQSHCTKGPWYNNSYPRVSLLTARDNVEHSQRRKVWDRGFGSKALRDYEPRVVNYTNQLLARIDASKGSLFNVSKWFHFYSFDVMGDLAFGKSFNMLRDGVEHQFMKELHKDMKMFGYLSHLVWLIPFFVTTPIINKPRLKFLAWLSTQVDERLNMNPDRPDVFSWIVKAFEANSSNKQARMDLESDAHLIIVAGSDTTAASLTSLFFHLATCPNQVKTLRSELDRYFQETKTLDHVELAKLKHLNALINETLRLHPPVPSGLQRVTPPGGLQVGDTFIPGNIIVQIPVYTTFRDKRLFDNPDEFIPERWTTRPELVKDASSFLPFSIGPYSCIGKQLAPMELRYVIAQIVQQYDMQLAPSQDPQAFLKGMRDTFAMSWGRLDLTFTARS